MNHLLKKKISMSSTAVVISALRQISLVWIKKRKRNIFSKQTVMNLVRLQKQSDLDHHCSGT